MCTRHALIKCIYANAFVGVQRLEIKRYYRFRNLSRIIIFSLFLFSSSLSVLYTTTAQRHSETVTLANKGVEMWVLHSETST